VPAVTDPPRTKRAVDVGSGTNPAVPALNSTSAVASVLCPSLSVTVRRNSSSTGAGAPAPSMGVLKMGRCAVALLSVNIVAALSVRCQE